MKTERIPTAVRYLQDYRTTLRRHPATQWAANIYRLHRGRSAEVSQRAAAA